MITFRIEDMTPNILWQPGKISFVIENTRRNYNRMFRKINVNDRIVVWFADGTVLRHWGYIASVLPTEQGLAVSLVVSNLTLKGNERPAIYTMTDGSRFRPLILGHADEAQNHGRSQQVTHGRADRPVRRGTQRSSCR